MRLSFLNQNHKHLTGDEKVIIVLRVAFDLIYV